MKTTIKPYQKRDDDLYYGLEVGRKALMDQHNVGGPFVRSVGLNMINNFAVTAQEKSMIDKKLNDAMSTQQATATNPLRRVLPTTSLSSQKPKINKLANFNSSLLGNLFAKIASAPAASNSFTQSDANKYRSVVEDFNIFLGKHSKYKFAVNWGTPSGSSNYEYLDQGNKTWEELYNKTKLDFEIEQNSAWRRKCKGGLEFAVYHRQNNIHFCLDGFDFEQVIHKSTPSHDSNPGEAKRRGVTSAELRWIYRNRNFVQVQERIYFWRRSPNGLQLEQCQPPWEWYPSENGGNWGQYHPKRERERLKIKLS